MIIQWRKDRQAVNELKREFNVERWKEEVYSTENVNYRLQFEKNLLVLEYLSYRDQFKDQIYCPSRWFEHRWSISDLCDKITITSKLWSDHPTGAWPNQNEKINSQAQLFDWSESDLCLAIPIDWIGHRVQHWKERKRQWLLILHLFLHSLPTVIA